MFEKQFKALYLPLGMYALRLVSDIDQAEDIVQEAFLKSWKEIDEGKEIGDLKSGVFSCVRYGFVCVGGWEGDLCCLEM